MYSNTGRPSIPPEWLLEATVLMALYTVRSERMFCEQLGYNLLFKWSLDVAVTPDVAQNRSDRRSAIDGRTTRREGYSVSIAIRRMIERVFGWMKTTANFRRTRLKGRAKTAMAATFVGATYNLMRLARLLPSPP
jgi:hypothetical protein